MFLIIYYLLGICGVLRMLWETFFPEADFQVLLAMTAGITVVFVLCHLLCWLSGKHRRSLWAVLAVILLLSGAAAVVWPGREERLLSLREGFGNLYQSVTVTSWNHFYPSDPVSRTELVWNHSSYLAFGILLAAFGALLYAAAVGKASRIGVLLAFCPPLAAVLAVGEVPSFAAISLLALCCVGIFAGGSGKQADRESWCRKVPSPSAKPHVARALTATALALVLLLVSRGMAAVWDGRVGTQKLEARQWVRDTFVFMDFPEQSVLPLPEIPGLTSNPGELSNEDEIRYTGEVVAALETGRQPEGTLYLKNFSGSVYTGHGWDMQEEDMEPDSYFMAVWLEDTAVTEVSQDLSVNLYDSLDGEYVPYFSRTVGSDGDFSEYQCFWPANYMELAGTELLLGQAAGNGTDVRAEAYLAWPDTLRRLKQICDENPQGNAEEVRRFIVSWLADTCSYNLQVGRFPEDRDPIEYFLFERGEGYCQHFASAAVMMFRMYGIPARYATGLAVSEDLFHETGEGSTYAAYPTDRCAHAWVEIYQDAYGWIPVEVTPAGAVDGVSPSQQEIPLTDPATESQSAREDQPETTPTPELTGAPEQQTESQAEAENPLPEGSGGTADPAPGGSFRESDGFRAFLRAVRTVAEAAGILALAVLALWIRRTVILTGRRRKSVPEIFGDLMEVLEKGGLPAESDWLEDDFAQEVCGRFSWLEEEQVQETRDLAAEAIYGKKRETGKEAAAVRRLYLKCCREICRGMGKWEKFRFRVWDAYY